MKSFAKTTAIAMGLAGALLIGNAATAAVVTQITVFGDDIAPPPGSGPVNYNDDRATLSCTAAAAGSCLGFIFVPVASRASYTPQTFDAGNPAAFTEVSVTDPARADLYRTTNSSIATEVALVNKVTGSSFATGTKYSGSITTNATYFAATIGTNPRIAIFENTTGGLITLSWEGMSGEGAGLSHWTVFDGTVVPLPAAAWLMLAGLGGLGLMSRRKAKAA